jgi:hypothetical protein
MLRRNGCNEALGCKGETFELHNFITGQPAQKGEITNGTRATTVEAPFWCTLD